MNAGKTKPPQKIRKKALNLSVSRETLKKGNALKKLLNRPSISNVVEHLIEQESRRTPAA